MKIFAPLCAIHSPLRAETLLPSAPRIPAAIFHKPALLPSPLCAWAHPVTHENGHAALTIVVGIGIGLSIEPDTDSDAEFIQTLRSLWEQIS
jgi:hypothetical protein